MSCCPSKCLSSPGPSETSSESQSLLCKKHIWNLKLTNVTRKHPVPKDIKISRSLDGKPIETLCREINVTDFNPYGRYMAKVTCPVPTSCLDMSYNNRGFYIVVTGLTPSSSGEGKSTVTMGLVQGLSRLKKNAFACIRQPSQGPIFGTKGGAGGSGYSQVWPMDDFNLHLTGDIHAVTAANNLLAAALDSRMQHESTQSDDVLFQGLVKKNKKDVRVFTQAQVRRLARLGMPTDLQPSEMTFQQRRQFVRLNVDPETVTVHRVTGTNDEFLQSLTIRQPSSERGHSRKVKFDMTVSCELMSVLALANDLYDLHRRVQRMVIGFTKVDATHPTPKPILCDDLCAAEAICALLKDAIFPTLLQTLEGSPVFVHCAPYANIAHGCSSVIADRIALDTVGPEGYVVTESGYGADIGFEKFVNIKCRSSGMFPDIAVLVATVKGLIAIGRSILGPKTPEERAIEVGLLNMEENIRSLRVDFRTKVVLALNKYEKDSPAHISYILNTCIGHGANESVLVDCWANGGEGAEELAKCVIEECDKARLILPQHRQRFSYINKGVEIEEKIRQIATKIYNASDIRIDSKAATKLALFKKSGYNDLPICIAKTHYSFSHDPKRLGVPVDYTFPIKDVFLSAGAGYIIAVAGEIVTLPGLPIRPDYFDIIVEKATGKIHGLL